MCCVDDIFIVRSNHDKLGNSYNLSQGYTFDLELFKDDSILSIFFGESLAFWYCQTQPQSFDIVTK